LNLALQNYGAVGNTPVKFVNNYKNWVTGNFTPAGPLAALENQHLHCPEGIYAKVPGGGTASSQALTDTASATVDIRMTDGQLATV
jgi:hypothetical protein